MPVFRVGQRIINEDSETFIIAEIGQNHQGSMETAKELIRMAKDCGVDCVKLQKSDLQEKFSKSALEKTYDNANSWGKTYGDHKRYLEFSLEQHKELKNYAESVGIMYAATPMDEKSLQILVDMEVPFIKIASNDTTNVPFMKKAAQTGIPLIISTGMQDMETVKSIYNLVSSFHQNFALLHCVSSYPAPVDDLNMSVINLYKKEFPGVIIGYSGHEAGVDISAAAVFLGIKILERHITLDHDQKGSDHKCSLNMEELNLLVKKIRIMERAYGRPIKTILNSEKDTIQKLGKCLVAAKDLKRGDTLKEDDIKIKVAQPYGINAKYYNKVLNRSLLNNIGYDETIFENDLEGGKLE